MALSAETPSDRVDQLILLTERLTELEDRGYGKIEKSTPPGGGRETIQFRLKDEPSVTALTGRVECRPNADQLPMD